MTSAGIARTAPCPCGSARRYKDCHGAIDGWAAAPAAPSLSALERALAHNPAQPLLWQQALAAIMRAPEAEGEVGAAWAIGSARPLRVAVITAYAREDVAMLRRCHDSVRGQTYPCRHFMVADGAPREELDRWPIEHLRLPHPHRDYGDTPRAVGGEAAAAQGFDAVAYLDADNTYRPRHVESLVCRQQSTRAAVCYSGRTLHLDDGQLVPGLLADDSAGHVDTSCMFLARGAFPLLSAWTAYPRALSMIGDSLVMQMLRARGIVPVCTGALTLRYAVNEAGFYHAAGRPVPADLRPEYDFSPLVAWLRGTTADERAACSARLGFSVEAFLRRYLSARGVAVA